MHLNFVQRIRKITSAKVNIDIIKRDSFKFVAMFIISNLIGSCPDKAFSCCFFTAVSYSVLY